MKILDSHYVISRKQTILWVAVVLALIVFSLIAAPQAFANESNTRDCAPWPGVGWGKDWAGGWQGLGNSTCCEIVDGARVICFTETQDFTGYDFSNLFLRNSLMWAPMENSTHHNTDWAGTDFGGSSVAGANFTGANLSNTFLANTNITQAQLDSTASCRNAVLPAGLTCHNQTGSN